VFLAPNVNMRTAWAWVALSGEVFLIWTG